MLTRSWYRFHCVSALGCIGRCRLVVADPHSGDGGVRSCIINRIRSRAGDTSSVAFPRSLRRTSPVKIAKGDIHIASARTCDERYAAFHSLVARARVIIYLHPLSRLEKSCLLRGEYTRASIDHTRNVDSASRWQDGDSARRREIITSRELGGRFMLPFPCACFLFSQTTSNIRRESVAFYLVSIDTSVKNIVYLIIYCCLQNRDTFTYKMSNFGKLMYNYSPCNYIVQQTWILLCIKLTIAHSLII